jgi:class 3 adenylate cyclase
MGTPISVDSNRLRIDFKEIRWERLPSGTLKLAFEFDERRYEWVEDPEEGRLLHDLSTDFYFPESVVYEAGSKVFEWEAFRAPDVPDINAYIAKRRVAIKTMLDGLLPEREFADPSSEILEKLIGESVGFAAVSIDLVGSTRLQASDPAAYNKIVAILLNEIAMISALFKGVVIKYTGDGAIIGFPEPGFCIAADMAFDAATGIAAVVHLAISPALKEAGLPPIQVRVGADANEGLVTAVGAPEARRQVDVLGLALSMAAKVQAQTAPGEVWIGQTLYEILHVSRQQLTKPAVASDSWDFVDRGGDPYRLFYVAGFRRPARRPPTQ